MNKTIGVTKLNSITVFLGFTAILFIISICINTFYWSDDYAFMVKLNQKGVIGNCVYGYNTWDGRFFALVAFIQGFFLKYIQIEVVTFFWTLTFILSGMLLVKIVQQEVKFIADIKKQLLLGLVFTVTFWLGCYKHLSETVYWGTGGGYSLDLLLAAIWIYWYLKKDAHQFTISNKIYFIVFSFIVGATTQNLTIAILALLFIDIVINFLKKENKHSGFLALLFLVTFLGLLFISIAPGNFARMDKSGMQHVDLSVVALLKGFLKVGFAYAKISIVLVLLTSIAAIGMLFYIVPNAKLNLKSIVFLPRTKVSFIQFLSDYKWLLVAISTILPFMIGPRLAFPRTSLFFMYFLMIFILTFIYKIFKNNNENLNTKSVFGLTIFISIFFIGIVFGIYNFSKGVELKKFMTQREELLRNNKGKTVTIKLVNPEMESPCYDITDLSLVENEMVVWRRLRLEEYYNVNRIIVEE